MFEFSRMGLILFVAGTVFFLVLGRWLLPERKAQELAVAYQLGEYITELRVHEQSPLIGRTVVESRLGEEHDVTVLRILSLRETVWAPLEHVLKAGHVLLVRGKIRELMRLRDSNKLELNVEFKLRDETLQTEDLRLVQALVAPGSELIGHNLKEVDFRNRYKALVLAIQAVPKRFATSSTRSSSVWGTRC